MKEFSPRAQQLLRMLDGDIADVDRIVARAEQLADSHWWVFAANVLKAMSEECEYAPDVPTLAQRGARLDTTPASPQTAAAYVERDLAEEYADRQDAIERRNEREDNSPARIGPEM